MTLHTDGSSAPPRRIEIHMSPGREAPPPRHPLDSVLPSALWAGLPATLAVLAAGVYITRSPVLGLFGGLAFAGLCWGLALLLNLASPARSARAPVFAAALMLPLAGAACLHARTRWAQYDADLEALSARSGPQAVAKLVDSAPFFYRIAAVHAIRQCFDDAAAYGSFVAEQYGVDKPFNVPEWPTTAYIQEPSRYPAVADWFTRLGHASAAMRRSFADYVIERGEVHFREAGIPAPVVKEIVRGMREAVTQPDATRPFDAMDRFAEAGLSLDSYLRMEETNTTVTLGGRYHYGADSDELERRMAVLREAQQALARYSEPHERSQPPASTP
ncbi:MAG TPA: hypothetical protein VFJ82_17770 [Longimicrobium sp.]|nr:hypothetical protein [Longimicrobium sp.]